MSYISNSTNQRSIRTLTGNTGGALEPIAGNINLLGSGGITITGDPTTATLTVSGAGFITQLDGDTGSALPSGGIVAILSGTSSNLVTEAIGDTVFVDLDNNVLISGAFQANVVESTTFVEAGTYLVALTGNISAPHGDMSCGGSISSVGSITTSANISTATGTITGLNLIAANNVQAIADVLVGDALSVKNDLTITIGNLIVQSGSATIKTTLTAEGTIKSLHGNVEVPDGDIIVSDDVTIGGMLTVTGAISFVGTVHLTTGDFYTDLGSIYSGDEITAVNDITGGADFNLTNDAVIGGTLTVAGNTIITTGDFSILSGDCTASGSVYSSTGSISALAGSVTAADEVTAVNDIVTSSGDLIAQNGDLQLPNGGIIADHITITGDISCRRFTSTEYMLAGTDLRATNHIVALGGDIIANNGSINTLYGDIVSHNDVEAVNGNLYSPTGDCLVGLDMVAGYHITAALGDIEALEGDIFAKYNIETSDGDMLCHTGDIIASGGLIRAGGMLIADNGLRVTGTSTLVDLTTGVMQTSAVGVVSSSTGTDGQILIANTAGTAPVWANITSTDSSVDITNGASTIDLKTNALFWVDQTTTSVTMAENTCYSANNAGLVTCTLPATCEFGKRFKIVGFGAGGWKLAQNASQQIHDVSGSTTSGAGGYIESTSQYENVEVVCVVADTTFRVIDTRGNPTIV